MQRTAHPRGSPCVPPPADLEPSPQSCCSHPPTRITKRVTVIWKGQWPQQLAPLTAAASGSGGGRPGCRRPAKHDRLVRAAPVVLIAPMEALASRRARPHKLGRTSIAALAPCCGQSTSIAIPPIRRPQETGSAQRQAPRGELRNPSVFSSAPALLSAPARSAGVQDAADRRPKGQAACPCRCICRVQKLLRSQPLLSHYCRRKVFTLRPIDRTERWRAKGRKWC